MIERYTRPAIGAVWTDEARMEAWRQVEVDPDGNLFGRRIGVEVAVNTSFNVAGPIAQTVPQTIDPLRRSKGLDAVLIFAEEGSVFAVWHCDRPAAGASRFLQWFELWRAETGASTG